MINLKDMTNIEKYHTTYIVYFKDKEEKPIEISSQAGEMLKKDINELTFVPLNWSLYNKYEIKKIQKRNQDYDIYLSNEKAKQYKIERQKRFEEYKKTWILPTNIN